MEIPMTNRTALAFIAFTVLWVTGVGVLSRERARSEVRRLGNTAAHVWLQVIPPGIR
jgi:hypothetical protein